MMTGLSVIEGIDLDAEVPCGSTFHESLHKDEPASYVVRCLCPTCGDLRGYAICHSGWALMAGRLIYCGDRGRTNGCGAIHTRDEFLTIVEVLR